MKKWAIYAILILGVFVFDCCFLNAQAVTISRIAYPIEKPPSTGPVKVQGRQLLEDFDGDSVYNPFLIKGVGYQPYPIGRFPGDNQGNIYDDTSLIGRDYPYLKAMYANTMRSWGEVTPVFMQRLDELNGQNNYRLTVIAGFWIDPNLDFDNSTIRSTLINDFRDYVNQIKGYNSLLFWAIGNENNYFLNNDLCKKSDFYSLANEMAQAAYEIEGPGYHPVAIVNGDILDIGRAEDNIKSRDIDLPYVDIWGANIYLGYSFLDEDLFNDYANRSNNPFWISEYGLDAYDNDNYIEEEAAQADYDGHLWDEIVRNTNICIGATVMEYSDEWWKPEPWYRGTSSPWIHDRGGFYRYSREISPDSFFNEEYWGIVRIDNGTVGPRQAYYTLKERFSRSYMNQKQTILEK